MVEVAKHNTSGDCWVVIAGQVVDLTAFLDRHPGGGLPLLQVAGKDATADFDLFHAPGTLEKEAPECIIGTVAPGAGAPAPRRPQQPSSGPPGCFGVLARICGGTR